LARRELRPSWRGTALRLDLERQPEALPGLRASLASYSGHLRHGAAYRKWVALWGFWWEKDLRGLGRLIPWGPFDIFRMETLR